MIRLQPLVRGGGQERGLRSGTENVAGTIGFAVALELAQQHRNSENKRLRQLRDQLQNQLTEAFPWGVFRRDCMRQVFRVRLVYDGATPLTDGSRRRRDGK